MCPNSEGGYKAFCPDLALIREGKDPLKLKNHIERVARSYVRNVLEQNLSGDLLNQSLPDEYMAMYHECLKAVEKYEEKEELRNLSQEAPRAMEWASRPIPASWGRDLAIA